MEDPKKEARTWHYIQKPNHFEIVCPKCGSNECDWSEYAGHIWCYKCKLDIWDYESPMSGPVPIGISKILGIDLRIYNMVTKEIEDLEEHKETLKNESNNSRR